MKTLLIGIGLVLLGSALFLVWISFAAMYIDPTPKQTIWFTAWILGGLLMALGGLGMVIFAFVRRLRARGARK